jgi:hypothetical protein
MTACATAAGRFAAGMHHASRAVKQQALSKRAMLRMPGTAATAAAGQPGSTEAAAAAAAAGVADGSLLDSATGAFVHGVEDDVVQVGDHVVAAKVYQHVNSTDCAAFCKCNPLWKTAC